MKFTTLESSLAESSAEARFRTLLLTAFAGLAIVLALAGIFGLMASVVSHRSNEIGVRVALGANSVDVTWLVLRQALALTGGGLAFGFAAAFALTRVMTNMLFEVKPSDPLTYGVVALLLAAAAVLASYLPARRANRIDPIVILRQE